RRRPRQKWTHHRRPAASTSDIAASWCLETRLPKCAESVADSVHAQEHYVATIHRRATAALRNQPRLHVHIALGTAHRFRPYGADRRPTPQQTQALSLLLWHC